MTTVCVILGVQLSDTPDTSDTPDILDALDIPDGLDMPGTPCEPIPVPIPIPTPAKRSLKSKSSDLVMCSGLREGFVVDRLAMEENLKRMWVLWVSCSLGFDLLFEFEFEFRTRVY